MHLIPLDLFFVLLKMKRIILIIFVSVLLTGTAEASKEEAKKIAGINPCPHLNTSEYRLIEMFNKTGHRVRCCGCNRNQYLETVCSKGFVPTCRPCPPGTELNAIVHNHGLDACVPIPATTPPAETSRPKSHFPQADKKTNTDHQNKQPMELQKSESQSPEKNETNKDKNANTGMGAVGYVLLGVVSLTVVILIASGAIRSRPNKKEVLSHNSSLNPTPEPVRNSRADLEANDNGPSQAENPNPNERTNMVTNNEAPFPLGKTKASKRPGEHFCTKTAEADEQSAYLLGETREEPTSSKPKAIADADYSALIREPGPPQRGHDGPSVERPSYGSRIQQAETHLLHMNNISISPTNVAQLLNKFKVPVITQERLERKFRQTDNDVLMYLHDALKEIHKDSDTFSVEILIEYWRDNGLRALATDLADKMGVNIA